MASKDKGKNKGIDSALKIVKEEAEKLLELLGAVAKVEVLEDKENEAINVQIESEEPGVVIGRHGETLSSIQLLLGIIASRRLGEWKRILVNVGDWRETREKVLEKMASLAAQKSHFSGEPVALPPLPPAERRIIHVFLSKNPEVSTESEGEGSLRRVIVKPAK